MASPTQMHNVLYLYRDMTKSEGLWPITITQPHPVPKLFQQRFVTTAIDELQLVPSGGDSGPRRVV
jgi:hypothetical protein